MQCWHDVKLENDGISSTPEDMFYHIAEVTYWRPGAKKKDVLDILRSGGNMTFMIGILLFEEDGEERYYSGSSSMFQNYRCE